MNTLENYIEENSIEISSVYIRGPLSGKSDTWKETADYFRVTLNNRKNGVGYCFDYFKGVGLRRKNKPVKPSVYEVLDSLCTDAESGGCSFNEFCDNYGYSNDSIEAFDIYRDCMEAHEKLNKIFSTEHLSVISEFISEL